MEKITRSRTIKRRNGFPVVFDNGGKTADQYTIVYQNGDSFNSSFNPFWAQGIGMFAGNIIEDTRRPLTAFIDEARSEPDWLGHEVPDLNTLPDEVKKFIRQNR